MFRILRLYSVIRQSPPLSSLADPPVRSASAGHLSSIIYDSPVCVNIFHSSESLRQPVHFLPRFHHGVLLSVAALSYQIIRSCNSNRRVSQPVCQLSNLPLLHQAPGTSGEEMISRILTKRGTVSYYHYSHTFRISYKADLMKWDYTHHRICYDPETVNRQLQDM